MLKQLNKNLHLLVIGGLILIFHSCAIPEITQKEAQVNLPASFSESSQDTINAATVNWNDFFEDPYLSALIDSALINNKEINIVLQKISMAENEIQVRRGEYLPFLNAGLGADVEKVGAFTRNGAVEESLEIKEGEAFPEFLGNLQLGVYASWELDVWKKLRNAQKVAALEYLASREGKNFLVTNLVAEIANSYYELLALDNQLENLEQNIQIQKDALEVVKLLQQAARATSLAIKRFEAEVQKNQSEIYQLKQQIVETENTINFLIGRMPQPIPRNSSQFIELNPAIVGTGIPSQLLENRPDIRKAELELSASDLNIQVAKADFYPSFGIKAGVGYQAFNPKYLLNTPESLLLSLAGDAVAPLVNRRAIKAQYQNANAQQIQAAFEYEQTILNAYREVANLVAKMDNLQNSYQLKSQQVDILTESIEVAIQLFQSARAEYLEVLLTQRDALEAKMELIETKKEQMSAMVDLYKALGGGWR